MHGKRHVAEAYGLLSAHELAERVCSAFDCSPFTPESLKCLASASVPASSTTEAG